MMAGKFITKMFDSTTKQLEIGKSDIELLWDMDNLNLTKTIEEYFQYNVKESKYTYTGNGKVSIFFIFNLR